MAKINIADCRTAGELLAKLQELDPDTPITTELVIMCGQPDKRCPFGIQFYPFEIRRKRIEGYSVYYNCYTDTYVVIKDDILRNLDNPGDFSIELVPIINEKSDISDIVHFAFDKDTIVGFVADSTEIECSYQDNPKSDSLLELFGHLSIAMDYELDPSAPSTVVLHTTDAVALINAMYAYSLEDLDVNIWVYPDGMRDDHAYITFVETVKVPGAAGERYELIGIVANTNCEHRAVYISTTIQTPTVVMSSKLLSIVDGKYQLNLRALNNAIIVDPTVPLGERSVYRFPDYRTFTDAIAKISNVVHNPNNG